MSSPVPPASQLPRGTVTLLFTDIEGSTRHLERLGPQYAHALADHHRLLRAAFQAHQGHEMSTEGDAFFVVFHRAADAVAAAAAAQYALDQHPWPGGQKLRVRMGLHTGEPAMVEGHYIGMDVHRAARISQAGHGGQILLSQTTYDLVAGGLPRGVRIRDLGAHRLKDLQGVQRLYQLVLDGLPDQFPPLKTLDAYPHNLPLQLTPLFGREADVARLRALLEQPSVRLVTLTGPGGVGKTRLSLQVAADAMELFPDGVFFVPLAALTDPALVLHAIAQALGVAESERRLVDSLKDFLATREMLIILDNFEQLLAAALQVSDLLRAGKKLKALVTSRAPLQIQGEHELPITPLELPPITRDGDHPHHAPRTTHEVNLTDSPAIQLFIERAQAVRPDFTVSETSVEQIARICQRLDGLPLAIELAAARARLRSPAEILAQLERPLHFLTGGGRDRPDRQQTMRQAIDWSARLLDAPAATLFRRLAVFVEGWTLEAAEAVCLFDPTDFDSLDALDALVSASLVRPQATPSQTRYTMLQTIREYARERLQASGEGDSLARRHAEYCLTLAEEAVPHYEGPEQGGWLDRMEAELDNLRAALRWCRAQGEVEMGLGLAAALDGVWMRRGYFSEGRHWLDTMLALPDAERYPAPYAAALFTVGMLAYLQGDYTTASQRLGASLDQRRARGDTPGIVLSLNNLALVARDQGDYGRAAALFEEALALNQARTDRRATALSYHNLSLIHLDQGAYDQARPLLEQALALFRALGDQRSLGLSLLSLGIALYQLDDLAQASQRLGESLALLEDLKDRWGAAIAHKNLALVALKQGEVEAARASLQTSLAAFREMEDRSGLAECLQGYAALAQRLEESYASAWLLAASQALLDQIGAVMVPADRAVFDAQLDLVRAALPAGDFEAAWASGGEASLEAILEAVRRV